VTIRQGADRIISDIDKQKYNFQSHVQVIQALATSVGQAMGGTSGALYRIFLTASARSFQQAYQPTNLPEVNDALLATAFQSGVEAIKEYGGADEGYRTMLDALIPASNTFTRAIIAGFPTSQALHLAAETAQIGAEATKNMRALAGRSNYLSPDRLISTPDPGAKAVAIWLQALSDYYNSNYNENNK